MTVYWPVREPLVTEEAGTRGGAHAGIDLAAKLGDPVLAAFDGEVVYVGGDGAKGRLWVGWTWVYANGEGKTVDIRRSDGLISRVCHLSGYAVKAGQKVKAGDVVGYAGSTGFSLGVHVHWETRWNRNWTGSGWVNPRDFNPRKFVRVPNTQPPTGQEEDEMKNCGFYYTRKSDGAIVYLIINFGSGAYHEYTNGGRGKSMPGTYNNPVAAALGTGSYASITEGHAKVMKEAADKTRQGK